MCDSVRLYENKGDAEGHRLAEQCIEVMVRITSEFDGTLIRTQGDGVMSTFPTADLACQAARAMQEAHRDGPVRIKVGFNCGPVIHGSGDVYGDAVNLAARIMGLAKAGEILTTGETVAQFAPEHRQDARLLDRALVKGKSLPVNVYALVDETDVEATVLGGVATAVGMPRPHRETMLQLECHGHSLTMNGDAPPVFIGRSPQCGLVVNGDFASRSHAFIEARRDHFVLTDQSTNGTYVATDAGELYLKRESARLLGTGVISLGVRPGDDTTSHIRFNVHQG